MYEPQSESSDPLGGPTFVFGRCSPSEQWVLRTALELQYCSITITMAGGIIQAGRIALTRTVLFDTDAEEATRRLERATPLRKQQRNFVAFARAVDDGMYELKVANGLPVSATGKEFRDLPPPACA